MNTMQSTVTLYLVFMGVGQLIFGPLSDRIGRKSALFAGLLVFIVGALTAAVANSLSELLLGRVLQGLGGAAAPVIARAILRDLFAGQELARNMAIATGIFSIGPILGPLLGVSLVHLGGSWRIVFITMALYAIILLCFLWRLPETIPQRNIHALNPAQLWRNTRRIIDHRQSRYFMIINGIMLTSMVLIISGSPLIFSRDFGVTGALFAILFALHGFGIIVGQFFNHQSIERRGVVKTAFRAALTCLMATSLMVLLEGAGWLSAYALTFCILLFAAGFLSIMSNSMAMSLAPHGDIAGFASSLTGSTGQLFAGAIAGVLSLTLITSTLSWAIALFCISAVCALLLHQWSKSEHPPT